LVFLGHQDITLARVR